MQLSETTKLKEIKQTNQTALTFCAILQTNEKPQLKTHTEENISLHKTHHWDRLFQFLLPGSTKRKKLEARELLLATYLANTR